MSNEQEDQSGYPVSEQDINDALRATHAALPYILRLPNELAVQLPNVIRCLQELKVWRVGSDLPIQEPNANEKVLLKVLLPVAHTDVQKALALVLIRETSRLCKVLGKDEVAAKEAISGHCVDAISALGTAKTVVIKRSKD